ncbi:MAG: PGF-pre-PGF domain-containing protein [Candidatus Aenigmarchaeota archaeon]|nr:PGF-pre-PGF domain-containing protein [Candidatus Aenigmarchaeota archaeon]
MKIVGILSVFLLSLAFVSYSVQAQNMVTGEVTRTFDTIKPYLPRVITENVLAPAGTPVYEIKVEVSRVVFQARVSLDSTGPDSVDIPSLPGGLVYDYFNVSSKNMVDSDIKTLSLKFKVDKEWLESNKVPEDGVKLLKLSSGQWDEVETAVLPNATGQATYQASPNGFAIFAVAGESAAAVQAPAEEVAEVAGENVGSDQGVVEVASGENTASEKIQNEINWVLIGAAAVVIVLILVFLPGSILRKKNKNPWKAPMR